MSAAAAEDALAALAARIAVLERRVDELAGVDRSPGASPGRPSWVCAGTAAQVLALQPAGARKVIARRNLGEVVDGRWRVDVARLGAFVAADAPHCMTEFRRRFG